MRAVLFHGTKKILHADDVTSAAQQKELHNIAGKKKRVSSRPHGVTTRNSPIFCVLFWGKAKERSGKGRY